MKTKFTKGEWKVKFIDLADFGVAAVHNDEKIIAQCNLNGRLSEETKANAKLMSAAPKLLKSCLEAKALYEANGVTMESRIGGEQYSNLISAIKKATE